MSAYLALLVCAVFVLGMLYLERRATPSVSLALWIPTLWMLQITSKPLGVWFGQVDTGEVDTGSALDRNALTVILLLTIWVLVQRRYSVVAFLRRNLWVAALLGFMLLSICWSEYPFTSFKRWVRQLQAVLMVCLVLSEADPVVAAQTILRRVAIILIPVSVLLVKYFPEHGVVFGQWLGELMWVGVTTQKNALGRLCLIAGFFLLWSWATRWRRGELMLQKSQFLGEAAILAGVVWLIRGPSAMAASVTALSVFAFGSVVLGTLFFYQNHKRKVSWAALGGLMMFLVTIGILTPLLGGATVAALTGSVGRDATLTGRTDIWAWLVGMVAQNPVLGTGFGGFWTPETIAFFRVNEAHNGYLAVILETGLVGMGIAIGFWLSLGRLAQRGLDMDFEAASLCICFLLMSLLHNVSESSMNILANPLTATVMLLALSLGECPTDQPAADHEVDTDSPEPVPGLGSGDLSSAGWVHEAGS